MIIFIDTPRRFTVPLSLNLLMSLAHHVARYCDLLADAATDNVKTWNDTVVQQSLKWSLFIECELAALNDQEVQAVRTQAANISNHVSQVTNETLMDAHHSLYQTLLTNPYLCNELFWQIMRSYRFLNRPEETCQDTVLQVSNSGNVRGF